MSPQGLLTYFPHPAAPAASEAEAAAAGRLGRLGRGSVSSDLCLSHSCEVEDAQRWAGSVGGPLSKLRPSVFPVPLPGCFLEDTARGLFRGTCITHLQRIFSLFSLMVQTS